jgi:leucyl-tRNA synthetase
MYRKYGADTLRLYEMAMGPLEVDKPWRTDDVIGVHRFLQRLWRSMVDEQTGEPAISDTPLDAATERALHTTIAAVRRDFGLLRFNTAIARLMELVTVAARVGAAEGALPRTLAEPLVLMVAPLAPHVAEELWAKLGHAGSLAYEPFPEADPALAKADTVTVPVQVNGRTRFRIEVPAGSDVAAIEDAVRAHAEYPRWTGAGGVGGAGAGADGTGADGTGADRAADDVSGSTGGGSRSGGVDRMVVVPGRIVNIILR